MVDIQSLVTDMDSRSLTSWEAFFICGNCQGDPGPDFWRVLVDKKPQIWCKDCAWRRGLMW